MTLKLKRTMLPHYKNGYYHGTLLIREGAFVIDVRKEGVYCLVKASL